MGLQERFENIYTIDTNMCSIPRYMSAYLVVGKEIALIDTGLPTQLEAVKKGIRAHGFSVSDISYIFITHCEHPDHAGNVAPLLREATNAFVYINRIGEEYVVHPEIEENKRKAVIVPANLARFGTREPTPASRVKFLKEGDTFDLGNGEKLEVFFSPGHQPSGITIYEHKNKGHFINDLVGNYFPDCGAHYTLNPIRSDLMQCVQSLKKLLPLPIEHLYLGHYGICGDSKAVMNRAIRNYETLLDMGAKLVRQGQADRIFDKVMAYTEPEFQKILKGRGEFEYNYASKELVPTQARLFATYCKEKFK